jgi:ribonuclease T1
MARSSGIKLALTGLFVVLAWVATGTGARSPVNVTPPMTVSVGELPHQGSETYRRILQGGPFLYEKDGIVFGNRERQLPIKPRGYYHEYTVPTPGAHNRGIRRIVCGGPLTTPDACYYTADHYDSFRQIVP